MFILVLGYGLSDIETFGAKIYASPEVDSRAVLSMVSIGLPRYSYSYYYEDAVQNNDETEQKDDERDRRLGVHQPDYWKPAKEWRVIFGRSWAQIANDPFLSFFGSGADQMTTPSRRLASAGDLSAGDLWAFRKLLTDIITG
jgi:hypothetical protein